MAANASLWGFLALKDLFADRVTAQNLEPVLDAVRASSAYYTNQVNELLGAANVVERTTEYSRRFAVAGGGTLQPLDEWGNPLPVRDVGHYDVSWPLQGGGTAWGNNRVTRAMMTIADVERLTMEAQRRDADWMRRHIMAAIFDNATWSFTDREYGALTIQPLANGDAVTYPLRAGGVATDTHYLAQAAAIDNANNPFTALYNKLYEHPENSGPYVAYCATDQIAAIEGLTTFVPVNNPNVIVGDQTATLTGVVGPGVGDVVRGMVDLLWIIEWGALPSGYIVGHARGGAPPLRMREYSAPALQGFFPELHSPDGNLAEHRFIRYAGFGAFNRVAMAVQYIGSGTYAIPTGYNSPLAA